MITPPCHIATLAVLTPLKPEPLNELIRMDKYEILKLIFEKSTVITSSYPWIVPSLLSPEWLIDPSSEASLL